MDADNADKDRFRDGGATVARERNLQLEAVIRELGWSQDQAAAHYRRTAAENPTNPPSTVTRVHINSWVRGSRPEGAVPSILCETFTRALGRVITPADIGLAANGDDVTEPPGWDVDTVTALVDLGGRDMDMGRRQALVSAAYSAAGLALPGDPWWNQRLEVAQTRQPRLERTVTSRDVEGIREMTAFFSQRDQRRGGRAGRTALVGYLRTEVAEYLRSRAVSEQVRRELFSAAGELVYLAGWTGFDANEHPLAQHYFQLATQLAADAGDGPLAGHILRAMAHQAVDLHQPGRALQFADASMESRRYSEATSREKALLGVVHARSLAAAGRKRDAGIALNRAEDDLNNARDGVEEPSRVFFFGEASLAHETACTLRDMGYLERAEEQFHRSVRTRLAQPFARTHVVTLGYLGSVQARRGHLDEAIATWTKALDAMDGVQSGRAREAVVQMRRSLSPVRGRGGSAAAELDDRARGVLRRVG
ncbi:tetratricopeptide repeat protein [Streptomyces sp. Edi2]|uniref:tetratricopeptide repeat protein n=1 Tax=Streptomyces sp. Edi2 TaxID=3162528 RepID=UPI003305A6C8